MGKLAHALPRGLGSPAVPPACGEVSWNYLTAIADSGLGYSPPGMRSKCGEPDLQQIEMDILYFLHGHPGKGRTGIMKDNELER